MNLTKKFLAVLCMTLIVCMAMQVVLPISNNTVLSAQASSKVKLSKKKATLTVGDKLQLKVVGTKKKVTWSSSNKKIAKVSKKGLVTAVKAGNAKITAKVGYKKYTCTIIVKNKAIEFNIKCDLPKPILAKDKTWTTVREYEIIDFDYDIIPVSGGFKCKLFFAGTKTSDKSGVDNYSSCPIVIRLYAQGNAEINHVIKSPKVRVGESWSLRSCTWETGVIEGNPTEGTLHIDKYASE